MAANFQHSQVPGFAQPVGSSQSSSNGSSVDPKYFSVNNISGEMKLMKQLKFPQTTESNWHTQASQSSGPVSLKLNKGWTAQHIWNMVVVDLNTGTMSPDNVQIGSGWRDLLRSTDLKSLQSNLHRLFDDNCGLYLKIVEMIERMKTNDRLLFEMQIPEPPMVMERWMECFNDNRYFTIPMQRLLKIFIVMQNQLQDTVRELEHLYKRRDDIEVEDMDAEESFQEHSLNPREMKRLDDTEESQTSGFIEVIQNQKRRIETADEEKYHLENQIKLLQKECEHLKKQLEEQGIETEKYRHENMKLYETTNQEIKKRTAELNDELKNKKNAIDRKNAELQELKKEVTSLKKKENENNSIILQYQEELRRQGQAHKQIKAERDKLHSQFEATKKENAQYHGYYLDWVKQKQEQEETFKQTFCALDNQIKIKDEEIVKQKAECVELKRNIAVLKKSKEDLLTRLSKLAGAKLTHGNADITDLSDENRPTKIAEKFSELYDNEWTDALEELALLTPTEEKAIEINLDIVSNAYKFCSSISQKHADKLMQALAYLPHFGDEPYIDQAILDKKGAKIPQHVEKDIEDIRRSLAPQMIAVAEERFILVAAKVVQSHLQEKLRKESIVCTHQVRLAWEERPADNPVNDADSARGFFTSTIGNQCSYSAETDNLKSTSGNSTMSELLLVFENLPNTKAFAKKCAHLCWLMRIRDPKLHMVYDIKGKGKDFDTDMFRHYTRTGKRLDFLVWPALFLHESGPLLAKGVAQPLK